MNLPRCSICENATYDCIPSQKALRKAAATNKQSRFRRRPYYNHSCKINHFSLKGLGPRFTLKKNYPNAKKKLKSYVQVLNDHRATPESKATGELYQKFFNGMLKKAIQLAKSELTLSEIQTPKKCEQLLKRITPVKFLGTVANRRRLFTLVKMCITRSHAEYMYEVDLARDFNLSAIKWLPDEADDNVKLTLLSKGIGIVLVNITIPMIHKIFTFIPTRSYELVCMLKVDYNRAINKLICYLKNKAVLSTNEYGKYCKDSAYLLCKPKYDTLHQIDLSSFRIIAILPKRNDKNMQKRQEVNRAVRAAAKNYTFVKSANFFKEWSSFVDANRDKRMYIAKLDISDCFGSLSKTELVCTLMNCGLSSEHERILLEAIHNQFVMFGVEGKRGKGRPVVFKWNHGLLQGMKFSSTLSDLYISKLESKCFKDFNRADCFVFRNVDDYFFASLNRDDLTNFVKMAGRTFNINEAKTQSNMTLERSTQADPYIQFCGLKINTKNFRIKCAFHANSEMYKRYRFWNIKKERSRAAMIDIAMGYKYNNFYFQPALMDFRFNGIGHVMNNYFESMIYMAYKFDAVIMSATNRRIKLCHCEKILEKTLRTTKDFAAIVLRKVNKYNRCDLLNRKFRLLGLRAFELVLKRRSNRTYDMVIKDIRELVRRETEKYDKLAKLLRFFNTIPESLRQIELGRNVKFCELRQLDVSVEMQF